MRCILRTHRIIISADLKHVSAAGDFEFDDLWQRCGYLRTPTPAHIGAAPSLAARTKPPASRFPSARMRCAKAGAAVIRTNRFRASGGAHRSGTATAREAGSAHRFHGIAGRDAAGVRMPTAQGRPRPEKALGSLGKVASRRVPRAAALVGLRVP